MKKTLAARYPSFRPFSQSAAKGFGPHLQNVEPVDEVTERRVLNALASLPRGGVR